MHAGYSRLNMMKCKRNFGIESNVLSYWLYQASSPETQTSAAEVNCWEYLIQQMETRVIQHITEIAILKKRQKMFRQFLH